MRSVSHAIKLDEKIYFNQHEFLTRLSSGIYHFFLPTLALLGPLALPVNFPLPPFR